MMDAVIQPWTWGDWMWRGTLAGLMVAWTCIPLGVFLYLKRMSLVSDALAHVALPGIVVAFVITGSFSWWTFLVGAALAGVFATLGMVGLGRVRHVREDSAIGIVMTTFFAVGVILLSTLVRDAHIDLDCVLFGNILAISDRSLLLLGGSTVMVAVASWIEWRWLVVSSFDPAFVISLGVSGVLLKSIFMGGVALASVASFEAVGSILVIAFFIIPAAAAHLVARSMRGMLAVALAFGSLAVVAGMYLSIALNCSSAGAIVLLQGLGYLIIFGYARSFKNTFHRSNTED